MKNNVLTSSMRQYIVSVIFGMAFVTPIAETSNDTYLGVWYNGTLAVVPSKALCIFSREERQLIAANARIMRRMIDSTARTIERAIIVKDIIGIERNNAEVFVMSRSHLWRGTEKRYAKLRDEFVWDPLPYTKNTLEYVRDIAETYESQVDMMLRNAHREEMRDAMDFTPYEESVAQPAPLEDDGTVCSNLPEMEPSFNDVPDNDGSFTLVHPDRIILPTGQTLVKIKYRSRARYILLDEGFVSEDTTLPEIVGDLERQALHLGVNIWTDRLQRLRDIRKVMVERWLNDEPIGAADLVAAMNNKHPYHIVYSDLRLIRKIRWPDVPISFICTAPDELTAKKIIPSHPFAQDPIKDLEDARVGEVGVDGNYFYDDSVHGVEWPAELNKIRVEYLGKSNLDRMVILMEDGSGC